MTGDTPSAAASRSRYWLTVPLLAALLLAFWLLMVASIWDKSLTYDEGIHLAGGYTYWQFNDYRINAENGNLPQRVMALPVLLSGYRFPSTDQTAWHRSDGWKLGDQFLHDMGNDLHGMLWKGRAGIALLAVALALVVYLWSRRLFGPTGGLISLLLCMLSPTVLANGPLMVSDVAGALFFLLSTWALWAMLHKLTPWTLLASGLAMGGLFVAKMSAPLMVVIALVLIAIRFIHAEELPVIVGKKVWRIGSRGRQAALFAGAMAAHVLLVPLVIWTFYGFRYNMMAGAHDQRDVMFNSTLLAKSTEASAVMQLATQWHVLPEAYLYGEVFVLKSAQQRWAFMNGQASLKGWRTFFPYTFLVKTPLSALGIVLLAVLAAWAKWKGRKDDTGQSVPVGQSAWQALYATAPLWTLLIIYWVTVITSHLNIGHRHLLPVYPPMFVLAGASAYWLNRLRKPMAMLLVALLGLLAFETLYYFPNYLAYFNQVVGGPKDGYRHLVDSSLDWGQDLPALKKYLASHGLEGSDTWLYLSYFGLDRPESYQIRAIRVEDLTPTSTQPPKPRLIAFRAGVYCISATNLQPLGLTPEGPWNDAFEKLYQQVRQDVQRLEKTANDPAARATLLKSRSDDYWKKLEIMANQLTFARLRAHLRQREPDDMVNYSILIYRVSEDELRQALDGPMPEDGPNLLQQMMKH